MKILAIGPHPDDIEFGCAPILIKEIRRGTRCDMLVLSRGEAGSAGTPEGREQESRKAARLMGASIEFLDFGGDCHLRIYARKCFPDRGGDQKVQTRDRSRAASAGESASGSCRSPENWFATRAAWLVTAGSRN